MSSRSAMLVTRRLRAPAGDRTVLVEPAFDKVGGTLRSNRELTRHVDLDLQGCSLSRLIGEGRRQLIEAARDYTRSYRSVPSLPATDRVLMAGHQPVLFHPGVWFKNFALDRLSAQHDAVGINLVIDSDTLKSATIRVPGGTPKAPVVAEVAYDHPAGEIPHEERPLLDPGMFESFGERVAQQLAPLVPDPLIETFWSLAIERARVTNNLGASIAQARHQLEGELGLSTLELPQSQVCELPAFHWFTAHLLAHLPRFWSAYNDALRQYRRANRLRSTHHPVPELAVEGDWLEAPYWLWQRAAPRRRRLFVRQQGDKLTLSDRREIEIDLPLSPETSAERAVEGLAGLAERGIKLRSRALVTTLFARLLLSDLFLHGIGGAKYDELTDQLMLRFFGLEPPEIMVLSATLLLPLSRDEVAPADRTRLVQQLRELTFHPERFLVKSTTSEQSSAEEVARLVAEKRRWITTQPTRETAQARCRVIRSINEALQPSVSELRAQSVRALAQMQETLRANQVLSWREYAFCLHPLSSLRDFMLAFLPSEL